MSEVCVIWPKNTSSFIFLYVYCYTTSQTHNYLYTLFSSSQFSYFTCSGCCNHSSGQNKSYIQKKVRDRHQNTCSCFCSLNGLQDILCFHNPLVSFCLWVLNCRTQLASSSFQGFELRRWVWFIFDITLLRLVGVSLYG